MKSYQSYRIATWLIVLVLTLSLVDSNYESDIYDLEDEMTICYKEEIDCKTKCRGAIGKDYSKKTEFLAYFVPCSDAFLQGVG